jgi:hypothetical protein
MMVNVSGIADGPEFETSLVAGIGVPEYPSNTCVSYKKDRDDGHDEGSLNWTHFEESKSKRMRCLMDAPLRPKPRLHDGDHRIQL